MYLLHCIGKISMINTVIYLNEQVFNNLHRLIRVTTLKFY